VRSLQSLQIIEEEEMPNKTSPELNRRSMLAALGTGAVGLAAAGSAQAAILPEPETRESYDVVIIGSGMAGCAAALEAASKGKRVVMLEKMQENRMGGNSLLAGGGFSLPLEDTQSARDAYVEDYEDYCLGRGNSTIFKLMADNIVQDLGWLQSHGIALNPPSPWPPSRIKMIIASPGFFAGMPSLFRRMKERLREIDVALRFDTKARQLIVDGSGKMAGVRAQTPRGIVDFRGDAVIIATGGYAGNTQMLEAFSDPNAGAMMVRGVNWATGDGLMMAQAAGAGIKGMGGLMALHIAAVDPVETAAGQPAAVVPHAISINREGKRFIDESLGYVMHGKAVLNQPGQTTTLIFDDKGREKAGQGVIDTFTRLGLKVYKADTIAEIAREVGAPVEEFVKTVDAFNAASDGETAPNVDPPKLKLAAKIDKAPFFAVHGLSPGITLTFGGIMINDRAQALEPDGRVIPGLFAAGEGAGHPFHHDYIGGGSLTNCLVMGRIAGREAAA
jgi:flavocytochrome c